MQNNLVQKKEISYNKNTSMSFINLNKNNYLLKTVALRFLRKYRLLNSKYQQSRYSCTRLRTIVDLQRSVLKNKNNKKVSHFENSANKTFSTRTSFYLESTSVWGPKRIKNNLHNKSFAVNTKLLTDFFPYRKSFLCYCLIPLVGFVYTASQNNKNIIKEDSIYDSFPNFNYKQQKNSSLQTQESFFVNTQYNTALRGTNDILKNCQLYSLSLDNYIENTNKKYAHLLRNTGSQEFTKRNISNNYLPSHFTKNNRFVATSLRTTDSFTKSSITTVSVDTVFNTTTVVFPLKISVLGNKNNNNYSRYCLHENEDNPEKNDVTVFRFSYTSSKKMLDVFCSKQLIKNIEDKPEKNAVGPLTTSENVFRGFNSPSKKIKRQSDNNTHVNTAVTVFYEKLFVYDTVCKLNLYKNVALLLKGSNNSVARNCPQNLFSLNKQQLLNCVTKPRDKHENNKRVLKQRHKYSHPLIVMSINNPLSWSEGAQKTSSILSSKKAVTNVQQHLHNLPAGTVSEDSISSVLGERCVSKKLIPNFSKSATLLPFHEDSKNIKKSLLKNNNFINLFVFRQNTNIDDLLTIKNQKERDFAKMKLPFHNLNFSNATVFYKFKKTVKSNACVSLYQQPFSKFSKVEKLLRAYLSIKKTDKHFGNKRSNYFKEDSTGTVFKALGEPDLRSLLRQLEINSLDSRYAYNTQNTSSPNSRVTLNKREAFFSGLSSIKEGGFVKKTNINNKILFRNRFNCFTNSALLSSNKNTKTLILRKQIQKKQRIKKIKKENRQQEKRKRFTPRPVWMRYRLYETTLNNRNNSQNNEDSSVQKTGSTYSYKFRRRYIIKTNKNTKKTNILKTVAEHLQPNNFDNSFYSISRQVTGQLKRMSVNRSTATLRNQEFPESSKKGLWDTNTRSSSTNSQEYDPTGIKTVQRYLNQIKRKKQKEVRFSILKGLQKSTTKYPINTAEYQRNSYQRLQQFILNIKSNLTSNGQVKARASHVGFTKTVPFPKGTSISNEFLNSNATLQNSNTTSVEQDNEASKMSQLLKVLFLETSQPSVFSYAETKLNKLRLHWAYSKTSYGLMTENNVREQRWATTKQRKKTKNNKTQKFISTLLNNFYINISQSPHTTHSHRTLKRVLHKTRRQQEKVTVFFPSLNNNKITKTFHSLSTSSTLQNSASHKILNIKRYEDNKLINTFIIIFHFCALLMVLGISRVRSFIKFALIVVSKIIHTTARYCLHCLLTNKPRYSLVHKVETKNPLFFIGAINKEALTQKQREYLFSKKNTTNKRFLYPLKEGDKKQKSTGNVKKQSKKQSKNLYTKTSRQLRSITISSINSAANLLHTNVYKTGASAYKETKNKMLKTLRSNMIKVYTFLEKPGEQIVDWVAYLFLVEWASDIQNTIPESNRRFTSKVTNKLARALLSSSFGLSSMSSQIFNTKNNNLNNLLLIFAQRKLYGLYEALLMQFFEPDADLLLLKKKGMLFWDIWGDFITPKKVHSTVGPKRDTVFIEQNNINITELTSVKEEQIKLLENCIKNFDYIKKSQKQAFKKTYSNKRQNSATVFLEKNTYLGAQQFLSYQGKDTSLFVDESLPLSLLPEVSTSQNKRKAFMTLSTVVTLVSQIYSGLLTKQISKNLLIVGAADVDKTRLVRAVAGETELKIITDNAYRYATVHRGVAVGIKLLQSVFDSLVASPDAHLFLIEDIHAIGERRSLIVSDYEGAQQAPTSTQEIHEKNQVSYQTSKHVVTHYMKPYKGDFSMQIPTNQFCFDFFKEDSNSVTTDNQFSSENNTYSRTVKATTPRLQSKKVATTQLSSGNTTNKELSSRHAQTTRQNKDMVLTSRYPYLVRPAEVSANTLVIDNKKQQKTSSTRVKVALLADLAISSLSVKLDMITDLLVIIDSVKGNRGFVIFATTHVPYVLDPALRRPGRLDETIHLSKSTNYFGGTNCVSDFNASKKTVTDKLLSTRRQYRWDVLKSNKEDSTATVFNSRYVPFHEDSNLVSSMGTVFKGKLYIKSALLTLTPVPRRVAFPKARVTNSQSTHILEQKYAASVQKRKSQTYFSAGVQLATLLTSSVSCLSMKTVNAKRLYNVFNSSTFNISKTVFGKIGETFNNNDFKRKKDADYFNISYRYGQATSASVNSTILGKASVNTRLLTSIVFSSIKKQFLYKNSLLLPTLLSFENYSPLYEYPSPPTTNIMLPARRYENYKRSLDFYNSKRHTTFEVSEQISQHQNHRLVKRLYRQLNINGTAFVNTVQEVFRSEVTNKSKNKYTTFNNASLMIGSLDPILQKTSSSNWFLRNRILTRHRNAFTNFVSTESLQWWNGQLPEHNAETTVRSDIDWRYTFIKEKNADNNPNKSKITDIVLDFPDTDQHYNPRNRRWSSVLPKSKVNKERHVEYDKKTEIYSRYVFEAFVKAYRLFEKNREILDLFAYYTYKNTK